MAGTTSQTVTVDRISNSGNAIAQQTYAGKTIHVPAGAVGKTYEVRLDDRGGYVVAHLVDRTTEVQPRQPSIDSGPDTSDIADGLLDSDRDQSHSFDVRNSPAGGNLRGTPEHEKGQTLRSRMPRRKH